MYQEINHFANILCERTNSFLEDIVNTKGEYLPLYFSFVARSCYVEYDTLEEKIINIKLIMVEKAGFIIEVDPINGHIRSYIANQVGGSLRMKEYIADTIRDCIQVCWRKRLSIQQLVSLHGDGRYVTADLFA